jgi:hypothetical protein
MMRIGSKYEVCHNRMYSLHRAANFLGCGKNWNYLPFIYNAQRKSRCSSVVQRWATGCVERTFLISVYASDFLKMVFRDEGRHRNFSLERNRYPPVFCAVKESIELNIISTLYFGGIQFESVLISGYSNRRLFTLLLGSQAELTKISTPSHTTQLCINS